MRRWGSVLGTALVVGFLAYSISAPASAQTGLGLSPSLAAEIDRLAREEVRAGRTPGVAVGVVADGRLVYARGFGFANLAKRVAMTPETEFFAGDLTMQFTAAAILLLAQDGKLSVDDRVGKYVKDLAAGADVTIAQLLTQTSGFPHYTALRGIARDLTHPVKIGDLVAALNRTPAAAPPGAVYLDNPVNYLLAGYVVERVSGVPLSDYLEQHVFLPLVMNHTFLAGDTGIAPSRATGYTRKQGGFAAAPAWDPSWLAGDSGLVSTIYDIAKWDVEMPVLLRENSVRTMFSAVANSGPTHYGMGWVIDRRGGKDFVWSNGEISGYRAMNALLPQQQIAVIVFSNVDSLHGRTVTTPEELGARILDVLAPPTANLDNPVVTRAKEWLGRLSTGHLDRSELTPQFSAYLSDELVARSNFAALGPLESIVPIASTVESNGNTLYEFRVRFRSAQYNYKFEVTRDGKINEISLTA